MNIKNKQSIEQLVVNILQKGSISSVDLIRNISLIRPITTKQGVYRVLRKLKNEEKIVIHGKMISLNLHWIRKMSNFFSLAQFNYLSSSDGFMSFLNIQEKDKIVYYFKNLNLLDSFWGHMFLIFNKNLDLTEPIFVYNPNEWFTYARQDSEQELIRAIEEKNRQVLITIANDYFLNRELRKKFQGDYFQYYISKKKFFEKNNYYFNIFGDVLIEVFIDKKIANQLDLFFQNTKFFNTNTKEELLRIISQSGSNKLIISRNAKKSKKLKSILVKNFYIIKR